MCKLYDIEQIGDYVTFSRSSVTTYDYILHELIKIVGMNRICGKTDINGFKNIYVYAKINEYPRVKEILSNQQIFYYTIALIS